MAIASKNSLYSVLSSAAPVLFSIAVLAVSFTPKAFGDEITERVDGVYVEDATIVAAKKGENAVIKFKITNFGLANVNLLGIEAEFAGSGELFISIPQKGPQRVSGLAILEEETLDFSTSHLSSELRNLANDLEPGTSVEFKLVFSKFSTTAAAHVH